MLMIRELFIVFRFLLGVFVVASVFSCDEDDDYTPLEIITAPDSAVQFQNQTSFINIFENDSNIEANGILSVGAAQVGSVSINNNNTPGTILDDRVVYTSTAEYEGEESFQYTICNTNGEQCKTETITVAVYPPIKANLNEVPYETLSEYNFFIGDLALSEPVFTVLPYEPISSLFSDYAHKKRFVWMPENTSASYIDDGKILELPVGAVIIKSFFYENVAPNDTTKLIETRLMIKQPQGWVFAEYFWNDEQTEAYLDETGNGGFKEITWSQNGVTRTHNYRMPSTSECFTCHKSDATNIPIGIKPQNINSTYDFQNGSQNQLVKWVEMGYLEGAIPSNIETVVDYNDASASLEMRVRSYFDINCAHCHKDEGHCNYRSMRFAFDENSIMENLGVCVTPDTPLPGDFDDPKIIKPRDIENSIIYYRLNTTAEELRMPLLGRRLLHDEGVALIEEWIMSLNQNCD